MGQNPIKRIEALKPLSREHHHSLLLCWKIRQGLRLNIAHDRIKRYVDWFWNSHKKFHIEIEETFVFPVLGSDNLQVQQALTEHKALRQLFTSTSVNESTLLALQEQLNAHIRFEERILFGEVQLASAQETLATIEALHRPAFIDNTSDEFWIET